LWVYSREDLDQRLSLDASLGSWLDHWLFLHADETHSLLWRRPLGLAGLCEILGTDISNRLYPGLVYPLAEELESYRDLAGVLQFACPQQAALDDTDKGHVRLHPDWVLWIARVASPERRVQVIRNLTRAIGNFFSNGDLARGYWLSRRLSAELSHEYCTPRGVVQSTRRIFLREKETDLTRGLERLIAFATTPQYFTVTLQTLATPFPANAQAAYFNGSATVLFEPRDSSTTRTTKAIRSVVVASHPESAVIHATDQATSLMAELRLTHYVSMQLTGHATVLCEDGTELPHMLQQPFWTKGLGKRGVPQLPHLSDNLLSEMTDEQLSRWQATSWHMSHAISSWPIDAHKAASEVWQAIESYVGEKNRERQFSTTGRIGIYCASFGSSFASSFLPYLLHCINSQSQVIRNTGRTCDWFTWIKDKFTLHAWFERAFHSGSKWYFGSWNDPPAPSILFDLDQGLLPMLARSLRVGTLPQGLQIRLLRDFRLLYGVRNAVVHSGTKTVPTEFAYHLARIGMESLLESIEAGLPRQTDMDQ